MFIEPKRCESFYGTFCVGTETLRAAEVEI